MRTFLIAEQILNRPTKAWLAASSDYKLDSFNVGVAVYSRRDARVIVLDERFSLARLSAALRDSSAANGTLRVIAPSIIQYFASKMDVPDPIFDGINDLSKYCVSVVDMPVFRMTDVDDDLDRTAGYKHRITYASYPENLDALSGDDTQYLDRDGRIVSERDIVRNGVHSISVPLLFYHSGLLRQQFNKESLIVYPKKYLYERIALDEMMLRFPSRDKPNRDDETAPLLSRFTTLTEEDVTSIWEHNRLEWRGVLSEMEAVGKPMSEPVSREVGSDAFLAFNHLVLSGFLDIAAGLDVPFEKVQHIGIPLFARNGVTIPLGHSGIFKEATEFTDETVTDRIKAMLPCALRSRNIVERKAEPAKQLA